MHQEEAPKSPLSREVVKHLNHAHSLFYRGQRRKALATLNHLFTSDFDGNNLDRSARLLELQLCLDLGDDELARTLIDNLIQHPSWQNSSQEEIAIAKCLEERLRSQSFDIHVPRLSTEAASLNCMLLQLNRSLRQSDVDSANSGLAQLADLYYASDKNGKCLIHHAFGCAHIMLGDYTAAESSFKTALRLLKRCYTTSAISCLISPLRFSGEETLVQRSTIIHHLALAMLARGNAAEAFRLLISLVPHYSNDSRFWLRLAECCAAHVVAGDEPVIDERAIRACRAVLEARASSSSCSEKIPAIKRSYEFGAYAAGRALSMISDRVEKGCSLPVGYHYQTTLAYFYAVLGRREVLGELLSSIAGRNDLPPAMERMAVWMKVATKTESGDANSMVVDSSLGVFDYSMPRLVYNKALLGAMMGKYTESAGNLNRVEDATDVDLASKVKSLKTYLDMHIERSNLAKQFFGGRG